MLCEPPLNLHPDGGELGVSHMLACQIEFLRVLTRLDVKWNLDDVTVWHLACMMFDICLRVAM